MNTGSGPSPSEPDTLTSATPSTLVCQEQHALRLVTVPLTLPLLRHSDRVVSMALQVQSSMMTRLSREPQQRKTTTPLMLESQKAKGKPAMCEMRALSVGCHPPAMRLEAAPAEC